jgi:hypothetical protein
MHIEIVKHPIKGFQVRVIDTGADGQIVHLPHNRKRQESRGGMDRRLRQLPDQRQNRPLARPRVVRRVVWIGEIHQRPPSL